MARSLPRPPARRPGLTIAAPGVVHPEAAGALPRLRTTIAGAVAWSKLSGSAAVALDGAGVPTLAAPLGFGGSLSIVVQVRSTAGADLIQRRVTFTAAAPVPANTRANTTAIRANRTRFRTPLRAAEARLAAIESRLSALETR